MKIDLHVHTKKVKKSENISININSSDFKEKMKEEDIGIVAITNHNDFSLSEYKDFEDDKYILLPGVELDVELPQGGTRQLNIIYPPEEASILEKKVKTFITSKETSTVKLKKLSEIFDSKKAIFYADYKRHMAKKENRNWWNSYELDQLKKIVNKSVLLLDTNNAATLMILNASNFTAIIGSDVKNWKEYSNDARRLVETHIEIDSYDSFIHILKYDSHALKNIVGSRKYKIINDFQITEGEYLIKNLRLDKGVNIIFGPKATGKTEILRKINEEVEQRASHYESSKLGENFKELQDDTSMEKEFVKNIKNLEANLEYLRNYRESVFMNFHKFYEAQKKMTNVLIHKYNGKPVVNPDTREHAEIEIIEDLSEKLKSALKIVVSNNELLKRTREALTKAVYDSLNELWQEYVLIYKSYWLFIFRSNVQKKVDLVLSRSKGIVPKPHDIGLLRRYEEKTEFLRSLNNLRRIPKTTSKRVSELSMPGRKTVRIEKELLIAEYGENKIVNGKLLKMVVQLTKFNSAIKIGKISYLTNFLELKSNFMDILVDARKRYIVKSKIVDANGYSDFSNGEKALIVLFSKLNVEKDYYLLDEPDVYLGSDAIKDHLIPKISELVSSGKWIVIVTHNSAVGINTIPSNYIYRKPIKNERYLTYCGSIWSKRFENIENKEDIESFKEVIMNNFEGGKEYFDFRKGVYENKN